MEMINANDQILLDFYKSAKEEINNRIRLRDTLIAAYVTAVAAVIGFSKAINNTPSPETLYIIPYFCFAFTLLIAYHHLGAHKLSTYYVNELYPKFTFTPTAPLFEASGIYKDNYKSAAQMRALGQSIILLAPALLALGLNFKDAWDRAPHVLYWWAGTLACFSSLYVIFSTYSAQIRLTEKFHK